MMPLFMPLAVLCPSSLSKTARHIAHCASTGIETNNNRIKIKAVFFIFNNDEILCFSRPDNYRELLVQNNNLNIIR